MSMSKVENSEDADDKQGDWSNGYDALQIFPAEIWAKIVEKYHLTCSSPKETARNRLVCKAWRDVIDEHCQFRISLDDRKMDVSTLDHLTVKRCMITHLLTKDLPEMPIFRDASKLQELFVWGPISPPNFQALMHQFSKVNMLSLTDAPFQHEDLLKVLRNSEDLNNFWTQLKNLTISWNRAKDPSPAIFYLPVSHLESFTFSWHMIGYQLEDITLSISLFYLISRMGNLKKLDLQYYKYSPQRSAGAPPIQLPTENLQNVQKLESVRLTTNPFALASWIPLLKQQTRLTDFRIIDKKTSEMDDYTLPADLLDELKSILILNQNTLTSVEMTNYVLSEPLDCSVFQNMNLLKRLVLQRRIPPGVLLVRALTEPVHVTNLSLLPSSLETLSLSYLCCNSTDLNLMTDRLENIQNVKFEGIGHVVYRKEIPAYVEMENTGVTQQALENLAGKENMKDVFISFLFQDKFNVVLRKEKKYVKVGRLFMELLGNGDRPWPYINFDFEKARKGKQEILRSK